MSGRGRPLVAVLLAVLLALFLAGCGGDKLPPLNCDLNSRPCEFDFAGRPVRVELAPRPLQSLGITHLSVEGLGDFENLSFSIRGLNMDMGQIRPRLKKTGPASYSAELVLAACVLETMRFRAEFFEGGRPVGFAFDFDLRR